MESSLLMTGTTCAATGHCSDTDYSDPHPYFLRSKAESIRLDIDSLDRAFFSENPHFLERTSPRMTEFLRVSRRLVPMNTGPSIIPETPEAYSFTFADSKVYQPDDCVEGSDDDDDDIITKQYYA